MKAYRAWDAGDEDNCATVVSAETARQAKVVALGTDTCADADYINVRVQRFPQLDAHYRGRSEIDWSDPEDRKTLVELGWSCLDTSWECDACELKDICNHWREIEE